MGGLSIITGGGTGIGAALAKRLASRSDRGKVLVVGRRIALLESTKAFAPDRIHCVVADITTEDGRQAVADAVKQEAGGSSVTNLVHNAGVLEPVGPLSKVSLEDWRNAASINVDAPLFLTQVLLPYLEADGGGRILHISSGASQKPYVGWGSYCTTKAAFNMMYRVLAKELEPKGVHVGSARPGVVDTPMQDVVRAASPDVFPNLSRFVELKEQGKLLDPNHVAKFLDWLLHETSPEEFKENEWDIRETDPSRWEKP